MSLRNRLIFNVKWHRRIGLFCAFFVLLLSITGLLLNHTASLKLDSIKLHSSILASLYGLPKVSPVSFKAGEQWISHNGINKLYLEQQEIAQCPAPLSGAITANGMLNVLCQNELLLLTKDGELLENITPILGLPIDVSALALINEKLLLKTPTGPVNVDLDSLQFTPASTSPEKWSTPQKAPAELKKFLESQGPSMDLEQVMLDLHSGRLFGNIGVFIMDIVAILLIVLSITGFIAWSTSRKMRKG